MQQPMRFWVLLRLPICTISIEFPLKGNTLFPRVPVEDLLFKLITKSLLPPRLLYMHVIYNSCSLASSVILAMSSDEELVIAEACEEFETLATFEHSGEELADSRSMHFKHGGTNSS